MSETLILHHRYTSLFSEKIRLMLGYLDAHWQSVHAPFYPPRPAIDPIIDGYRQIPVAHIGADIFCDTKIIADEIARMHDRPELSPFECSPEIKHYLTATETTVVVACLRTLPAIGVLRAMARKVPCRHWLNYLRDKRHILKISNFSAPTKPEALETWQRFLEELEHQISDSDFLFGGSQPTIADFSAVHVVWFRSEIEGPSIFGNRPTLQNWYRRMTAFGHGRMERVNTAKSLKTVQAHRPRSVPERMKTSKNIGKRVEIAPKEMRIPTRGVLVGEDETRWVLERETQFGTTVHVHFPIEQCELTHVSANAP